MISRDSDVLKYDVCIIGAGAAGLMCAITAGKRGRRTLVIDHANKAGKKILMSGGGRCNFTNLDVSHRNFISHNPHFCKSALTRYTPACFIQLVEKHGIPYYEKTLGQLFCKNKSKDIVNMLLRECAQSGVEIKLNTKVNDIAQLEGKGFKLHTGEGLLVCKSLVVATGGLSIPTMGASPFGYETAKSFGLKVWPTRAGLVPFTLHEKDKQVMMPLAGISSACEVSCQQQIFNESMLFTHRGLSGPAILQISSYWEPGHGVKIKLIPEIDLADSLKKARSEEPQLQIGTILSRFLSKRHLAVWFSSEILQTKIADCSNSQIGNISDKLQGWQVRPNGTEGYRTAEVTLGGVDCAELSSKTFMCKSVPDLYFIGEVCDVTGWLGGYNFQWAWASGYAAGQAV